MAETRPAPGFTLFGVALDPTDDELKLAFKTILARDSAAGARCFRNPYEAFLPHLQDLIDRGVCEKSGEVMVPSWLTPVPETAALWQVTAENNLRFIDSGGCHAYAERVRAFLERGPARGVPAMIAVDHSMTGGCLRALSEKHGSSNLTVMVLDSHFDGLQLAERVELFRCCQADARRVSLDVPESYNCATWIKYLLDEEVVRPDRLIVFGVSDYPADGMRQDPRLTRYVDAYLRFEKRGVTFVTKEEIRKRGVRDTLEPVLSRIGAGPIYLSLDADIGALDAVYAARFMNVVGLAKEELYRIARLLGETLKERELAGFDVSGVETFLLGRQFPEGVKDRTLERLSDFVRILLGHEPRYSPRHCGSRDRVARFAEGFLLPQE